MQFAIRIHDRWHIALKDKGARFIMQWKSVFGTILRKNHSNPHGSRLVSG